MCNICAAMNPYLMSCEYQGLTNEPMAAPGDITNETGDAAAGTTTTEMLGLNEFFYGELSSTTDSDWIEITLEAGTYIIAGVGIGPLDTALNDAMLTLRDAAGNVITSDDFSGPGVNAELTVTVTSTTTYYIDVGFYTGPGSFGTPGTYGVSITDGAKAIYTDEMAAGNLMRPNNAWTTTPGTGTTVITWAFRENGTPYDDPNTPVSPFDGTPGEALDANQMQLTQVALQYIESISGIDFQQVNPGGTSDAATMLFGAYSAADGAGAFAYYPGSAPGNTDPAARAGDVWLNNDGGFGPGAVYDFGTFVTFAMLHEIGHALGLAHPGDYNAGVGVAITYANDAQYVTDSHQYTIMSYFDESETGATGGFDYPDTFMLHDYMALHALYGADLSYHAGDSTYGFNVSGLGADSDVYDFTINTTPFMTIYDGGGTDTIDLSGYAMANFLSLEQGVFSNIGGFVGRFSIAYGADIENAVGGTGADTIMGNDLGNVIDGGEGNDSILGGRGDDFLTGGAQFDHLDGGEGADTLVGGLGRDMLIGGEGKDLLSGGNGDDTMDGGSANDRLVGGRGNDEMTGGAGRDRLLGGEGDDTLNGGIDDDLLRGGTQNDVLNGGAGNDTMFGGAGFDIFDGGTGDDEMTGAFNADQFIFVDGHGNDTITDFEATNDFEKIDFSGHSGLNTLADVLGTGSGTAAATQVGANVVIDTGGGNLITLLNVNYADLDALDFTF